MKHIVVLVDGMADWAIDELGAKTPLECAKLPCVNSLAQKSEIGLVNTIPKGCAKGSDTANLSVLGYDPQRYYFGRSPLEALSMGVELLDADVTYRVNLVTVSDEANYREKTMLDHSADEITSEEAYVLIEAIKEAFTTDEKVFFAGVSYRHLLVWHEGDKAVKLTPPHDILGQSIDDYMPKGAYEEELALLMEKSYDILKDHPINKQREARGLKPANSIWIWGEGTKPKLPQFKAKYGIEGAVISAVDLLKGIAIGAGMESIDVEGATGTWHTNYQGKLDAAYDWLVRADQDFIYIHLEGPDECGHRGEVWNKIKAMERIDAEIIAPLVARLEDENVAFKLMVLPDHPTPAAIRTHTDEAVPYMIYISNQKEIIDENAVYTEKYAASTDKRVEKGHTLMKNFIG